MAKPLRFASLALVGVLGVPVLSACSTSPGAAAVVGSQRITTGALQSQVTASLSGGKLAAQQGFNRATFTRQLLGHLINVDLLNAVAADRHLTVTKQDITSQTAAFVQQTGSYAALQQQAAAGGVSASQLPGFIRYAALEQKLSTAIIATLNATPAQLQAEYQKDIDQYDELDVAQIALTNKKLANQVLAKAQRAPASFAALAERYSQDTQTQANGGEVGLVGRSQVVSLLGSAAKAKVGNVVMAHSSGEYVILHIISRHVVPISQVTAQLKSALFASQAAALLQTELTAEEKALGVHVSPRYGHWDLKTHTVVANKSATSSAG